MTGPTGALNQRRFTGYGLAHASLATPKDLKSALGPHLSGLRLMRIATVANHWSVYRGVYRRLDGSLYPPSAATLTESDRQSLGFDHEIFVAFCEVADLGRVAWIFGPYIQLLQEMNLDMREFSSLRGVRYVEFDMKRIYAALENEDDPSISARRVTLRITAEDNVELVSLTGKRPLRSDLHAGLEKSTEPWGIGLNVTQGEAGCRVTAHKSGEIFWYQSENSTLACPLKVIDEIGRVGASKPTTLFPFPKKPRKRASTSDGAPS